MEMSEGNEEKIAQQFDGQMIDVKAIRCAGHCGAQLIIFPGEPGEAIARTGAGRMAKKNGWQHLKSPENGYMSWYCKDCEPEWREKNASKDE